MDAGLLRARYAELLHRLYSPRRYHQRVRVFLRAWKLLFWTVFRRPQAFSLAVTFAIHCYHFRRTCEQHIG